MSRIFFLILTLNFFALISPAQVHQEKKYSGILPCADCEGLSTNLILKSNQQFELSLFYLGKSLNISTTLGNYKTDKSGRVHLMHKSDTLFTFRKTDQHLILQYQEQGNWKDVPVNNTLRLLLLCNPKQEMELSGKWLLRKSDRGDYSSMPFSGETPVLHLFPRELRFEGNSGCNEIFGNFRLKEKQFFFDEDIAASRMFCENSAEKFFLGFLPQVIRFERRENHLLLFSESGSYLEFELIKEE